MGSANFNLAGWPLKEWGVVLDIRSGRNQSDVLDNNGTYPIIGSAGKVMGYANSYICDEGTTVLGRKGTIDNPLYFEQKFWNVDTAFGLVAGSELDKKFLYYFCLSVDFTKLDKGTTLPSLVKKDLVKVLMPIPSIFEQQRIVSTLDQAFADIEQARAKTEQNLKNARELFESYLQQVFSQRRDTWSVNKLVDLTSLITKGSSPKWQGISYVEDPGVLFVTSENVGVNEMIYKKAKFVESSFNKKSPKSVLIRGDVLTNIVGASIGRTAIFDQDELANINQAVCLIRCDSDKLDNEYLAYLLNSPYLVKVLHDNEVDNARANLSLSFFRGLEISVPSVIEQKALVCKIKGIQAETDKLENIYMEKVDSFDELKKSILQKAFSGELTKDSKGVAA